MLLHVCSKYFCLIFNAKQKEEGEDKKKMVRQLFIIVSKLKFIINMPYLVT